MSRIPLLLCLAAVAWSTPAPWAAGADVADTGKAVKLFADETWYKQQAAKEQVFEGVLEKAARGGEFGSGRFNPFRLKMKQQTREIYMGGQLKTLEPYVGKRLRLRGKAVEIGVEGQLHREIWPAEALVLAGKDAAVAASQWKQAIKQRLAGKVDIADMQLDVMWGGRGSVTVYGSGVGLWNRQRQFRLDKSQLLGLLRILDEGGFASLQPGYGGLARPLGGPAIGAPEMLVGSITLRLGELTKGSMQRGGGAQSEALASLAKKILDVCEAAAKQGITVDSLEDGLKKVASGALHPLAMSLLVQRIENEGRGPHGWILRIHGRQAEVQLRSPAGIGSPVRAELTDAQWEALVQLLLDNEAADLPINLYAPDYTDFRVTILRFDKSLQARKFARLTPATHGEKQKKFDRIFAALNALQLQVVKRRDPSRPPAP